MGVNRMLLRAHLLHCLFDLLADGLHVGLRRGKGGLNGLLVVFRLLDVGAPLLPQGHNIRLEARTNALQLGLPHQGIDGVLDQLVRRLLQDFVLLLGQVREHGLFLLHHLGLIFNVSQVRFLVHFSFFQLWGVLMHRGGPRKTFSLKSFVGKEVQDRAHGLAMALLELDHREVQSEAHVAEHEHHLVHTRIRIVILVDFKCVSVVCRLERQPADHILQTPKLNRRVVPRQRKCCPRQELAVVSLAEVPLVVQDLQLL
mmetsp:Transcript_28883/g.84300  ORF Transcript_28883/g.84300 Transcript_28883/m.84300 type:complete len:257 (-) Transcript_28883:107-877(-)